MTETLQDAKQVVRDYISSFEADPIKAVKAHTTPDYLWRGMHPFYERIGASAVCDVFWAPFMKSFSAVQRRLDFFFAGTNDCDNHTSVWVCNAGHFMGLFDNDWLGIPSTGKIAMHRFAEFHRIDNGKITETALFIDVLSIMHQAGVYPLPPETGQYFVYPGPLTHDGVMFSEQPSDTGKATLDLINFMIGDIVTYNRNEHTLPTADSLRDSWHEDMIWFGPAGIGASYTIERYQKQHQYPFRENLTDKVFNGHTARFAEGHIGGFFGWPNLNVRNTGNFMGLPGNNLHAPMRVVDIYRRDGAKLAENWIYIDLLHYLAEQGLDVLTRSAKILGTVYKRPESDPAATKLALERSRKSAAKPQTMAESGKRG